MRTLYLLLVISIAFRCAAEREKKEDSGVVEGGELWCVARNDAEDAALQTALDWACGPGGADCRPIQDGGQCYAPDDLQSLASYAFNDYFRRNGFALSACDFSSTAAVTSLNPSHDNCTFPSSSSAGNGSFSGSSTMSPTGADMSGGDSLQTNLIATHLLTLLGWMVILSHAGIITFR